LGFVQTTPDSGRLAKIVVSEAVDNQKAFEGRLRGVEDNAVLLFEFQLSAWTADESLWPSPSGRGLLDSTFYTNFRRYLKRAGLPPSGVHILRHSAAKLRRDAGESIEDFCRACKTDRMHTVVAADAEGRPIRVDCGYCHSEHNYRGGGRIGAEPGAASVGADPRVGPTTGE